MKTLIDYVDDFGKVTLSVDKLMDAKGISTSKMVKLTGLHHKVIQRYYDNRAERYDREVLAKFCYVLECDISDILTYCQLMSKNSDK